MTAQLSEVLGAVNITVAVHTPGSVFTDTGPEHVIPGFSVSVTVTTCVQVLVFPAASLTVQVTVVIPLNVVDG